MFVRDGNFKSVVRFLLRYHRTRCEEEEKEEGFHKVKINIFGERVAWERRGE
jgi:hypothetical protein